MPTVEEHKIELQIIAGVHLDIFRLFEVYYSSYPKMMCGGLGAVDEAPGEHVVDACNKVGNWCFDSQKKSNHLHPRFAMQSRRSWAKS